MEYTKARFVISGYFGRGKIIRKIMRRILPHTHILDALKLEIYKIIKRIYRVLGISWHRTCKKIICVRENSHM